MKNRDSINRNQQVGHVMAEWVMTTFIVTLVLFAPLPGTDESIAGMMVAAIRDFIANNSYLLSLP